MATVAPQSIEELLLVRTGQVFVTRDGAPGLSAGPIKYSPNQVRGFDLELAHLGYVASKRLQDQLACASVGELQRLLTLVQTANRNASGGTRTMQPLFRKFPDDVPADTLTLWWDRVIVHVLQQPAQPCVLCGRVGTIHVLNPCMHMVCSVCFDGSNYSGCPICNATVDRSSPFFLAAPVKAATRPVAATTFALLDLGNHDEHRTVTIASRDLFVTLCQRTQAMSAVDVDALVLLVADFRDHVVGWLPAKVPVRENIAHIFGGLLRLAVPGAWLAATPYLASATDVLRLLVAYSGDAVALLATEKFVVRDASTQARFGKPPAQAVSTSVKVSHTRFKMAKMPRALRRGVLTLLNGLPAAQLFEDLHRHQARWIWVAEFLHPGEYATRFPHVASAFAALRNDGDGGMALATWASKVEAALRQGDDAGVVALVAQRPGEFVRRLDHVVRTANDSTCAVTAFCNALPAITSPALVSLRAHIAVRGAPLAARVYWPKANFFVPVPPIDRRPRLPEDVIVTLTAAIDAQLLQRFAAKSRFATAIIDDKLAGIIVPFNERTASRSAVQLPRGSSVAIPASKSLRLFIHWCEPPGGQRTDIDLSVGFFDAAWQLVGTCSYYQLTATDAAGLPLAKSSGDFTSAPWPDGASEFVDIDRGRALASGYRYAVMVVNAYAGLPFRELARATAGVMLRDDNHGLHFDPRTVELAFALDGTNGVFMPVVVDLATSQLHWLDAYAKGEFDMNNVASSQRALATICPAMLGYFASGTRPTMLQLAMYHAAARAARVVRRSAVAGEADAVFVRRVDEAVIDFLHRLRSGEADELLLAAGEAVPPTSLVPSPVLAILHDGNIALPEGSSIYALFRRQLVPTLAAADLLA